MFAAQQTRERPLFQHHGQRQSRRQHVAQTNRTHIAKTHMGTLRPTSQTVLLAVQSVVLSFPTEKPSSLEVFRSEVWPKTFAELRKSR